MNRLGVVFVEKAARGLSEVVLATQVVLLGNVEVCVEVWMSVCVKVRFLVCSACVVSLWFVVDCGCDVRLSVMVVKGVGVGEEQVRVGCPKTVDVV